MRLQETAELQVSCATALAELTRIPAHELAIIAGDATRCGEALIQSTGLARLDEASQCHVGAQLGRPVSHDAVTILLLHWWNDKSRSLTPGFIGELRLRAQSAEASELAVVGEYYPRAHLYELVPHALLARMANAVVRCFLDPVADAVLSASALRPAQAPS